MCKKLVKKAEEALEYFYTKDGDIFLKDDRPGWVYNLLQECFLGYFPHDWLNKNVVEILNLIIAKQGCIDCVKNSLKADEFIDEWYQWVISFRSYADVVLESGDCPKSFSELVRLAQRAQKEELLETISDALL